VEKHTTKLSNRIELDGDWEVGLAEIIYPYSWFNTKEEIITEYVWKNKPPTIDIYDYSHTIPAGYYQNPS
jgi:hypothetical protein